jgi:crotonobetainyl-CoA:carnitine CoA-transferase CaiB-like acyl-CoA transferase
LWQVVTPTLNEITSQHEKLWWLEKLEGEMVGCAPILHLDEVFADPHVQSLAQSPSARSLNLLVSQQGAINFGSFIIYHH